jgi:hypothetical protein
MVKHRLIILFALCFLCSCYPSKRLPGGTKVLSKKYKNIDKFDPSIYLQIDSNYFYKLVDSYESGKNYKEVVGSRSGSSHLKLQFYQHGYIRIISDFVKTSPDPEFSGMRGVIYRYKQDIRIDTQSADQDGALQRATFKVIVEEDRIYLVQRLFGMSWGWSSNPLCFVYEKAEKVPEDWKQYKPDW